ncbi:polysaccharide pyruvyl transferase family protein [Candidatus Thiodiazotropha sp. LNASS1]|uniref:polysaccharide pyruvyl transferase family protein n=1 Tax=Candidatus Thiodiazotropha sp. LNASS1 TaxID=3096260 RepID=UPI003491B305
MKTISIIAATVSGNRGAEAMLTTTIGRIRDRYPEANFNIYSYYPKRDRKLINDSRIKVYSADPLYLVTVLLPCSLLLMLLNSLHLKILARLTPESTRSLGSSDVLIDLAGVAFIDGREKFLPYNVLTLVPAFLLDTPVVKFSQAAGPFNNPLNHFLARHTLSRIDQIFARGATTHQHLQSLLLDTCYVEPVADVAFLHQPQDMISDESRQQLAALSNRLQREDRELIGICPSSVLAAMSQRQDNSYHHQIATLCRQLIAHGYAILLYPNATRKDEMSKLRNNDLPVIRDIVNQVEGDNHESAPIYYVDFDLNTPGIKLLMSYCRLVMVSRFHAMIAALASGQPVIVLGWSHKYQEVMDFFGLGDLVFDFNQLNSELMMETIRHTLDNEPSIRQKINQQQKHAKASAYKQFAYLFNLLDQGKSCK